MKDGKSKAPASTRQQQPSAPVVASGGVADAEGAAAMRGAPQSPSDSRLRPQRCGPERGGAGICARLAETCGPVLLGREYKRTFGDEEGGGGGGGGGAGGRRGAVPVVLVALFSTASGLAFAVYLITTLVLEGRCRSAQRAVRENPAFLAPGSDAAGATSAAAAAAAALLADSCSRGVEAVRWSLFAAWMLSTVALFILLWRARRQRQRLAEASGGGGGEGVAATARQKPDAAGATTTPQTKQEMAREAAV